MTHKLSEWKNQDADITHAAASAAPAASFSRATRKLWPPNHQTPPHANWYSAGAGSAMPTIVSITSSRRVVSETPTRSQRFTMEGNMIRPLRL